MLCPRIALVAAGLLAAAPAAARAQAVAQAAGASARLHVVDPARSHIGFTASSRLLDARGVFERWTADVRLDPGAFERSTVRITIDAASINTRNGRRDRHLRGADFLDVANYPTITFVSRSVARTSPTAGVITGDLTLRGVTKAVQVPVEMKCYGEGRGRFAGAFTLGRRAYGISYQSRLNPIADVVAVQFDLTVAEQP